MDFGKKSGVVIQFTIGGGAEAIVAKTRQQQQKEGQGDLFARKANPWLIEGDLSRYANRQPTGVESTAEQKEMF
jgi:hypothetical protein